MHAQQITPATLLSPTSQATPITGSAKAKAQATTGTSSGSSSTGGGLTSTTTGNTFLDLLVKELQNQDPTAPMDSTQMVGQMISLNQLDQLISINQTLSTASSSSKTTHKVVGADPSISSSDQVAERAALLNSTQNLTAAQAATQAATDPTSTLNLSTLNMPYGGK